MLDFAIMFKDDIALKQDGEVIVCGQAQSWVTYTFSLDSGYGRTQGWVAGPGLYMIVFPS